jgi:hypothetical protein
MITRENDILNQAIEAFRKETNFKIELGPQEVIQVDKKIDAILHIDLQGKITEYLVEIKAGNITAGQLIHLMLNNTGRFGDKQLPKLLVTRYVQPKMAKTLKNFQIQFIDTVGNAYINYPPTFIFIYGNKPEPQTDILPEEGILGRAGTQVIFVLLCKRELCNAPYRDIAEQAQVALGAVAKVMKDLVAQGFLVELNDKQRRLVRRKELLDKWLNAYAEKLRPKKFIDRYKATKPDFWQQAEIDRFDAQWGGEVAAYRLTRYLKPEIVTIYTRKPIHNLILNLKLRQDKNGDIELRERFWKCENPELDKTMVPPLLVYADLMATGETRNIETAKQLYNDYLQRYIDQD